jgi:hypothetical protein
LAGGRRPSDGPSRSGGHRRRAPARRPRPGGAGARGVDGLEASVGIVTIGDIDVVAAKVGRTAVDVVARLT